MSTSPADPGSQHDPAEPSQPELPAARPARSRAFRVGGIGAAAVAIAVAVAVPTLGAAFAEPDSPADLTSAKADVVPAPAASAAAPAPTAPVPPAAGTPQLVAKLPIAPAPAAAAGPISTTIVSQRSLLKLVKQNFPADQVGNAMAVAACESGQASIQGETNSDGTTDWGVFQLNDGGTMQGALSRIGVKYADLRAGQVAAMDARINVLAAATIFRDRGWSPWVCAYKQQIVAELYTNKPGPMYGRFTVVGGSLGPLTPQYQTDAKAKKAAKAAKKAAKQAAKAAADAAKKAAEKARQDAEKAKANQPAAKPAEPTPAASQTSASPTPSAS